jgi:hypothetical protein
MAFVRAFRDGNWSDTNPATSPWYNGSTGVFPPDETDWVYLAGRIIYVDQNVKVYKITNEFKASTTWKGGLVSNAANAGYIVPVGSVKIEGIICGALRTDGSPTIYTIMLGSSARDTTIVGTLSTTFAANGGGCVAATSDWASKLYVTGNIISNGSGANGTYRPILMNGGTLYFTGTIYGGYASSIVDSSGNYQSDSSGIVTGTNTVRIFVTGDVYGGLGSGGAGIYVSSGVNKLSVVGNMFASAVAPAIYYNNHYRNFYVSGNIIDNPSNGRTAIIAPNYYINPIPKNGVIYKQGNDPFFTTDSLSAFSMPPVSSVRLGATFSNGTLTGTCAMPNISSVSLGVPVDGKFGVSLLNPAAFFKTKISSLTPSTFVQRLTSTTSVDSIGKFLFSPNSNS